MIDSIRLRVHDLESNKQWLRKLRDLPNADERGMTKYLSVVDLSTSEAKDLAGESVSMIHEHLRLKDGHELLMYERKRKRLPSSHYALAYEVRGDYVQFDFSLPKALYGTNIAEFVVPPYATGVGIEKYARQYQLSQLMPRLKAAIKYLMDEVGQGALWQWRDIEIREIDMCYNQVFNSKDEAMKYLKCQKEIRRKFKREGSSDYRSYDTSIHYVGAEYTCKIYHKGTEYAKNDRKKHEDYNRKRADKMRAKLAAKNILASDPRWKRHMRNAQVWDCKALQSYADRILRYEIHFRGAILNRISMSTEFRKENKNHKKKVALYKAIRTATRNGERRLKQEFVSWDKFIKRDYPKWLERHMINMVHKKGIQLKKGKTWKSPDSTSPCVPQGLFRCNEKGVDVTIAFCSKNEWDFYRAFENAIRRRREMRMQLDSNNVDWFIGANGIDLKEGNMMLAEHLLFSDTILKGLHKIFKNFIDSFQVKKLPSLQEMYDKIDGHNEAMKKQRDWCKEFGDPRNAKKWQGVNKTKLITLLNLLDKGIGIDDIQNYLDVEPRTWRRYKADLKKVGIESQAVNRGNAFSGVSTSYKRYYEEADRMGKKLYINPVHIFN